MIRKAISISFLLLYLAFLILPSYPLLHYYFFSSSHAYFANTKDKNYSNGDHTKTGDMAYLSALLKSAGDKNSATTKNQNPPPTTNNEVSNMIYLVSGTFHLQFLAEGIPLHFYSYADPLPERYLKVLIPPPNSRA
ncbi:hypothetical protein LA303_10155 [Candidatus Sulfidibacterium hydrothermale]|uniref:hypothetical protein n=1 Tax=Candidatus Sulfidibacterium hydrothermale TaxID=2875962 RepID=UPI001F0AA8AC|nr:hypothetical protein [Candidatus Sulfidibacterium hydrothermale]UBM61766.1 hypothetical protein LA303_10155 [Candidatus Sulfidibacterium hydrothermale]